MATNNAVNCSTLPNYLPLAGGTMTGSLVLNADPTISNQASTKNYVDLTASDIRIVGSADVATTGTNLSATYNNGTAGVGATLTNNGAQTAFVLDGVTVALNGYVLVKDQTSQLQNGLYLLSNQGSGATNWVLTRVAPYDTPAEITQGTTIIVNTGTLNASTSWIETALVSTIGTDPIVFEPFSQSPNNFLKKINNLSDLNNVTTARSNLGLTLPIVPASGGTGIASPTAHTIPIAEGASNFNFIGPLTNGQIMMGNTGADPGVGLPTNGTNISWTGGAGTLTANLTGIVSPTLGGSGVSNPTAHGILIAEGASAFTPIVLTNGQMLIGSTGLDPVAGTITGSSTISVTTGAGTLALDTINITGGTYLPTLTNSANIDSSTAFNCQYMQVGSTVTVSGKASLDPTTVGILTQLTISLPIASNFSAQENCCGTSFASNVQSEGAAILADTVQHKAVMQWIATNASTHSMYFNFTYTVI
jgi:hypothetical protein